MDYLYGEASTAERQRIESHINACRACRNTMAKLRQTVKMLKNCPDIPATQPDVPFDQPDILPKTDYPDDDALMTPDDLARFLRVPLQAIFDLLHDIPYINLGGRLRFRRESVQRWLKMREQNSPDPQSQPVLQDMSIKLWRDAV